MSNQIDIFNIPLYYISFNKNTEVENHYKEHGFKNVNHFEAVNGKKLDPQKLSKDNLISIRSFIDLTTGRKEFSGMPSLGAVGCTLSHYELWNMCVKNNWPYIIVAEDDNRMSGKLTEKDLKNITNTLLKPNSAFISSKLLKINNHDNFTGTHFCILSNSACKQLIKNCFPIDVQLDWYISNESTVKNIVLEAYPISKQTTPFGGSSIQTLCFTCLLPKGRLFYIIIILLFIAIIIGLYIYRKRWKTCEKSCSVSKG